MVVAIEEQTKTTSSQRLIPIHSTLIALGFEKRVAKLRASGATHLFPEWYEKGMKAKRNAQAKGSLTLNHYFPRYLPKTFNRTIKLQLGIQKRKSFHSFRHSFKSALKDAGVEKAMRDDLCGHDDDSAGAVYLHGDSIAAKKTAIEKLRFDGFTLG